MITTYSGIQIQEGMIADQCFGKFKRLKPTSPPPEKMFETREDTFALPSQWVMLRLLYLFAGKPGRLPEKEIMGQCCTSEHARIVDDFVRSVLEEKVVGDK